jgi:hypothetical protein
VSDEVLTGFRTEHPPIQENKIKEHKNSMQTFRNIKFPALAMKNFVVRQTVSM